MATSIVLTASFPRRGTVYDDCLCRSMLWSRDRIHTQAFGEEWTKEDDDVKSFSLLKDWNTEFKIEYDY